MCHIHNKLTEDGGMLGAHFQKIGVWMLFRARLWKDVLDFVVELFGNGSSGVYDAELVLKIT